MFCQLILLSSTKFKHEELTYFLSSSSLLRICNIFLIHMFTHHFNIFIIIFIIIILLLLLLLLSYYYYYYYLTIVKTNIFCFHGTLNFYGKQTEFILSIPFIIIIYEIRMKPDAQYMQMIFSDFNGLENTVMHLSSLQDNYTPHFDINHIR